MVMLHEYDDDVEGARIEQRPSKRDLAIAGAIYLCISSFSMLAAWTGGFSFRSINPFGDANQYEWSFAWVAHAIATGQAPWYSSMLYHPHGVNLLANPAPFAISLVASPITWIFGPMASMNLAQTLIPVASGLAMYVAARHWVQWKPAAIVAGALWAFSPYAVYAMASGWLNVGSLFVLPCLVLILEDLCITQKRTWLRNTLALVALCSLQFFISTEGLLIYAIMIASSLLGLFIVGLIRNTKLTLQRLRYASKVISASVLGCTAVLSIPIWYALKGPANLGSAVWDLWVFSFSRSPGPKDYLRPLSAGPDFGFFSTLSTYLPNTSLFGIGLLAIVLVGGLWYWRRGITLFLLAVGGLSLWLARGYNAPGSLWMSFQRLPLVRNVLPERFLGPAWFAVALLLALVVDALRTDIRGKSENKNRHYLAASMAAMLLALAIAQPLIADARSMPYPVASAGPNTYIKHHLKQLDGHLLLTFPYPGAVATPVVNQALDGFRYRLVGGFGPTERLYQGRALDAIKLLVNLGEVSSPDLVVTRKDLRNLKAAILRWGVNDVIVTPVRGRQDFTHGSHPGQTITTYSQILGQPEYVQGSWHWHIQGPLPTTIYLSKNAANNCSFAQPQLGMAIPRCVAAHGAALPHP